MAGAKIIFLLRVLLAAQAVPAYKLMYFDALTKGPYLYDVRTEGKGAYPKKMTVQRSTLLCTPGLEKFVPVIARLFCLALLGSFFEVSAFRV